MDFPLLSSQSKEKFKAGYTKTVGNMEIGQSSSSSSGASAATATGGVKNTRSFADVVAGQANQSSDWASLVGEKKLSYHEPAIKGGKCVIRIPSTVCENASLLWADSLIAQFMGSVPSYGLIQGTANSLWGRKGPVTVMEMGNEAFLFKFMTVQQVIWF